MEQQNEIEWLHDCFLDCCVDGNIDDASKLLDTGQIDVNYDNGQFALVAARVGNVKLLELLSNADADLHLNDEQPLRAAAYEGHIDCVKFLVETCNADVTKMRNNSAYYRYKTIKDYFDRHLAEKYPDNVDEKENYKGYIPQALKDQANVIKEAHWRYSGELERYPSERSGELYTKILQQMVERYKMDDKHWYGGGHLDLIPQETLSVANNGEWVSLSGEVD